jgi:protoporphyrinogen oxidase
MKIAIIGAGVAGLTAAYRLTQHAHQVDIFEASDHLGGLASCFMLEHENAKLEKYYHHIFISDLFIRNLVKELNMEQDLLWLESSMGFYTQDQLYPFGSPSQLLHFSPLPFLDRIRFGLVVLYLGKVHQWKKYEKITAYEWISKYFGPNILKIIWEPLLRGKFGTFYNQVAMAWFWARVHTRASSRQGSIEKLGYFRGGFASCMIDSLRPSSPKAEKFTSIPQFKKY